MTTPVYLDGFATTPTAPEVIASMQAALLNPGNAGSPHMAGAVAAAHLECARAQVAGLLHCLPNELVFTSGATEANNLAISGVAAWALQGGTRRRRVVISAAEHASILTPALALAQHGFEIVQAPYLPSGLIDLAALADLVNDETLLLSLMLANNETGVIQPIREAVQVAKSCGSLLHCDAAQYAGKLELDLFALGVDFASISAHKMYGPMGIGALYIASDAPLPAAIQLGGGQERGLRSGTEPIFLSVGFGEAARLASTNLQKDATIQRVLAKAFLHRLRLSNLGIRRPFEPADSLPGAIALILPYQDGHDFVMKASCDISISTGSACSSGQLRQSHVLSAMHLSKEEAAGYIRVYFSRYNTMADVAVACSVIEKICGSPSLPLDVAASGV